VRFEQVRARGAVHDYERKVSFGWSELDEE